MNDLTSYSEKIVEQLLKSTKDAIADRTKIGQPIEIRVIAPPLDEDELNELEAMIREGYIEGSYGKCVIPEEFIVERYDGWYGLRPEETTVFTWVGLKYYFSDVEYDSEKGAIVLSNAITYRYSLLTEDGNEVDLEDKNEYLECISFLRFDDPYSHDDN